MCARRGATGLCGILLVDKPAGMTSHDAVAAVRRAAGEGRVGHAGTLDPMATGLLVVLVGAYTRLEPYLSQGAKAYDATIAFGSGTDTDDAEGRTVREADVPDQVFDQGRAQAVLDGFLGSSSQNPPVYSAIKVGGRTAHRVARAGGSITLAPREISVLEASLTGIDEAARTWRVRFLVSKGTYVRALARDIGGACSTAAHLSGLRRVESGGLLLEDAHSLDEVAEGARRGELQGLFADPVAALGLPTVSAPADDVRNGRPLQPDVPHPDDGRRFAVLVDGRLAAVYVADVGALVPEAVFPCEAHR